MCSTLKLVSFGRDLWALIMFSGMLGLSFGIFMSIWQLYLKSAGYTGGIIGLYNLVNGLVMTVLVIPAGVMADRTGRKRFLLLGAVLSACSTFLIAVFIGIPYLILSALLSGFSWASVQPALNALVADKAGRKMETVYSMSSFIMSFCMAAGSLIGWIPEKLVLNGWSYFEAYRLMIMVAGLIQLSTILLIAPVTEEKIENKPEHRIAFARIRKNTVLMRLFLLNILVGFGAGLSIPLFSYYFSVKFNVESGPIGTMYMVVNIVGSFLYLGAVPLSRRFGVVNGVVIPQAISVPLLALIPYSGSFMMASILYIFRSALMNMVTPLMQTLYMNLSHPEDRATVTAFSSIFWGLPNSISSQIGGILMDKMLDLPVLSTSAIYAVYVVLFYLLLRERKLDLAS